jgi:hypothetical protein
MASKKKVKVLDAESLRFRLEKQKKPRKTIKTTPKGVKIKRKERMGRARQGNHR